MDIESEELNALKGAKSIFGKVPLLIEYVANRQNAIDLREYLLKKYTIYSFNSNLDLVEFLPSRSYSSILCLPINNLENYLKLYEKKSLLRKKLILSLPRYGLERLKNN